MPTNFLRYGAIGLLALEGTALLIASPLLFILGGWGGSDYGGIWYGLGNVLGVPWLLYAACMFFGLRWLRRGQNDAAFVAALAPVIAMGALLLFQKMR